MMVAARSQAELLLAIQARFLCECCLTNTGSAAHADAADNGCIGLNRQEFCPLLVGFRDGQLFSPKTLKSRFVEPSVRPVDGRATGPAD
jgi:hypothetical protein